MGSWLLGQGDVAIKFEMWHRLEAAVVPLPPTPQQQVPSRPARRPSARIPIPARICERRTGRGT